MHPVARALPSLGLVFLMAVAACDGSESELDTGQTSAELRSLVDPGAIWHYWDRGALPDRTWVTSWEPEDTWPFGASPLGYGESYLGTTVGYGGDASHKNITTYFRHTTWCDERTENIGRVFADVMYDDGLVLYINGVRVYSAGMSATEPPSATELAAGHEAENKYVRVDLTPYRSLFGRHYIHVAAEVHQNDAASSDLVFDVAISYEGVVHEPGVLIPRQGTWRVWDQYVEPTGWQARLADTSSWRDGVAPLGYGETYIATQIARPSSTQSPTTLYRYIFNVDDPASVSALTGEVMYDDGVVVWLNGTRIDSLSMPTGSTTFQTLSVGHEAENTYVTRDWSAYRNLLVETGNVLAVELHQVDRASSDAVFDVSLRAGTAPPPPPPATEDIPRGATWTYWDNGGELGTSWRTLGYDDASWRRGAAPLGYGESYLATTIGYGPDANHKYRTAYFRNRFRVADHNAVTSLVADLMYDDGVVVYINGTEVKRLFMPAGTITSTTLASAHETGINYERYDLSAFRNLLVDGDNEITAEVHQSSDSSSDLTFDLALDVTTGAPPPPPPPAPGIARGSSWRYFASSSAPPGSWPSDGYDDASWPLAPGPLGYGESYIRTTIPYGPDPANKWGTAYVRSSFVVEDPALVTKMLADVMYDDGFVLYINGQVAVRAGLPTAGVVFGTIATSHEANNAYATFDISTASQFLHVGRNTIVVEVHQDSRDSSDLVFDLGLRLEARAAEGTTPRGSAWLYYNGGALPAGWQTSSDTTGWVGQRAPVGYAADPQPVTTYFRRHFSIASPADVTELRGELLLDGGAVVYLNGQEIERRYMPTGAIAFDTRAESHESDGAYEIFDWTAHRGLLRAGENVLAVEVHRDSVHTGSTQNDWSLVFDMALEVITTTTPRIPGCEPLTATNALTGVWIAPGGAVWAAGNGGLIGRRTASGWAWCRGDRTAAYSAVWGTTDDDVWFARSDGKIQRWNGGGFDTVDIGTSAAIQDIWGSSATDVFVVLADHTMRHFDGATWRAVGEAIGYVSAVWGANTSDVWAVGGHNELRDPNDEYDDICSNDIYRWSSATQMFTLEKSFTIEHGGCFLAGVGGSGSTDVWALGSMEPAGAAAGFAFAAHYDGVSWQYPPALDERFTIDRTYYDVAAHAPGAENGAWIVSSGRGAVRFDGTKWDAADDSLTRDLYAIDTRGMAMFAAGANGRVLRWNGVTWVNDR